MYIFIGLALLFILLIFLFAKKFTPNSFMMTSFKGNSFKTFSIGILIAAALSLSYGIYHAVTYQPSHLDIQLQNQNHTVFGNVGEFGYFSEELLKKDVKTKVYFVSWEPIHLEHPQIKIDYPSGKQEIWTPTISSISTSTLKEKHKIEEIYQLSPYTFKESGKVTLTIQQDNKTNKKIILTVK
ncbi:hypothetical protein ACT1UG_22020 [Bacillus paramycoides]|uniref:hypothetical protein n=1 Tax=Bacillus paramycoides TaxID=2026194 RepID=UPI0040583877